LIGETVSEKIILDGLGSVLRENETYLSGDYSDATNQIFSYASEAVADQLAKCLHLGEIERDLFRKSLTGHLFEMPDGTLKRQARGQLMGSVTSFPVLCLINAAVCRWAMEIHEGRKISLRDCQLLVNGDDCVMRSRIGIKRIWAQVCAVAGLKESLGKTYESREFLEINSQIFLREEETHPLAYWTKDVEGKDKLIFRQCPFRQVEFVNTGLLTGAKRSAAKVGLGDIDDPYENIGMRAQWLVDQSPMEVKSTVMRQFLKCHREVLERTRCPFYIPQWLGGLGLPCGDWGEPSELDLRLAHKVLLEWKQRRPVTGTKEGWQTWRLASSALPEPLYTSEKGPDSELYQDAVTKKCIDLLFDSNVSLEDLHVVNDPTSGARLVRMNARLYVPPKGKLPQPLPLWRLEKLKRYPNWRVNDFHEALQEIIKTKQKEENIKTFAHTNMEGDEWFLD